MPALRTSAVLLAAVALAGCGQGDAGSVAPAVTLTPGGHVCFDRAAPGGPGLGGANNTRRAALGPDEPAAFVQCDVVTERVPGRGEWTMRRERQAVAGTEALAAALRLPNLPSTGDSCLAYADVPPELWALDGAGRAVLVHWPLDGCGHLRREAPTAHAAVHWGPWATRRLRQVVSQAAIDSGCVDRIKQMAAIEGPRARSAGTLGDLTRVRSVNACTYAIDDRSATPTGAFEAGRTITGPAWQDVRGALESAPPATRGCSTLGQRFAVLTADPGGNVYVELDGCRRVLLPDGGLRLATPRLLQDLAGS